jgi:hypothetical protein
MGGAAAGGNELPPSTSEHEQTRMVATADFRVSLEIEKTSLLPIGFGQGESC